MTFCGRYPRWPKLLHRAYDAVSVLADRHALTFYDASYLDLALRENLPIASLDHKLVSAAEAAGVHLFRR